MHSVLGESRSTWCATVIIVICCVLMGASLNASCGENVASGVTAMSDQESGDVLDTAIRRLRAATHLSELIIAGEQVRTENSLVIDTLTFVNGGTLVLMPPRAHRDEPFVLAIGELRSDRSNNGGRIEWRETESAKPGENRMGQADIGQAARGEGQIGGRGEAGLNGDSGEIGLPGPTIILIVKQLSAAMPYIINRGQTGGGGGQGQMGGPGGHGADGIPASQSLFDCRRGSGGGGDGGPGGPGGAGGAGGHGGRGGTIRLLRPKNTDEGQFSQWVVDVSGGAGGEGGTAGEGGPGGLPGRRGRPAFPLCGDDASNGVKGTSGLSGAGGLPGNLGPSGTAKVGFVDPAELVRIGLPDRSWLRKVLPF